MPLNREFKLATDTLARFFDDMRAAVSLRVPIQLGRDSSTRVTVHTIEKLQQLTSRRAESNDSDAPLHGQDLPPALAAAFRVFKATGSSSILLDGLVARNQAEQEVTKLYRWPVVYISTLLLVCLAGQFFFGHQIVPLIQSVQADFGIYAYQNSPAKSGSATIQVVFWIPVTVSVFLFGWVICGGPRRLVLWLGGREFVGSKVMIAATRAFEKLVSSGMHVDEARKTSQALVAADTYEQQLILLSSERVQAAGGFGIERNLLDQRAANLVNYLRLAVPSLMITFVGSTAVLAYGLVLFWPLVELLATVVTTGDRS